MNFPDDCDTGRSDSGIVTNTEIPRKSEEYNSYRNSFYFNYISFMMSFVTLIKHSLDIHTHLHIKHYFIYIHLLQVI